MVAHKNQYFWFIIENFNKLMKAAIKGPDCTNPLNCRGDCCSIKIDVPKILAEEFIKRNYATNDDFIRSDIFAFELRFDEKTGKCFLFDTKLNGCLVHNSEIKPPQCWIYPTNFSNPENTTIKCKKLSGWEILDPIKALKAEKLLEEYNFLCIMEARKEMKAINKRLNNDYMLKQSIKSIAPSKLGGFIDKWDNLDILQAEGFSLQMKKFCLKYNTECSYLPGDFMECKLICNKITNLLTIYIRQELPNYIKKNGPDTNGEYPLFKLFNNSKFNL